MFLMLVLWNDTFSAKLDDRLVIFFMFGIYAMVTRFIGPAIAQFFASSQTTPDGGLENEGHQYSYRQVTAVRILCSFVLALFTICYGAIAVYVGLELPGDTTRGIVVFCLLMFAAISMVMHNALPFVIACLRWESAVEEDKEELITA
ncbi:hypothetical protein PMAYCL1PPCAC_27422 [Pristionchus mayeri]|uniref:Uncharacterized protein n=1 Tax=Pristionchus mayeri TaxID=1317129 RepID=A0AAN5D708_9BILA|nr:hypothetical protein PMAYCL1PPCAC_27422 [Pristionchus mayeri]